VGKAKTLFGRTVKKTQTKPLERKGMEVLAVKGNRSVLSIERVVRSQFQERG